MVKTLCFSSCTVETVLKTHSTSGYCHILTDDLDIDCIHRTYQFSQHIKQSPKRWVPNSCKRVLYVSYKLMSRDKGSPVLIRYGEGHSFSFLLSALFNDPQLRGMQMSLHTCSCTSTSASIHHRNNGPELSIQYLRVERYCMLHHYPLLLYMLLSFLSTIHLSTICIPGPSLN